MKTAIALVLAIASLGSTRIHDAPATAPASPIRLALICFKTGEQTSGMNKICYYDCAGSQAATTVGAAQVCPVSINR